jgi:hypothetical protein
MHGTVSGFVDFMGDAVERMLAGVARAAYGLPEKPRNASLLVVAHYGGLARAAYGLQISVNMIVLYGHKAALSAGVGIIPQIHRVAPPMRPTF